VIFNAWPYFREYLQNTLQRMELPRSPRRFCGFSRKQSLATRLPEEIADATAKAFSI
jgi:hypothetical protein